MRRYHAEFLMQSPERDQNVDAFQRAALTTANLFVGGGREEVKVAGNQLLLWCDAPDKESAYKWAETTAVRFSRLISMKTGQHFTAVFRGLDSVPGEPGQSIISPLQLGWWVDTYELGRFSDDVAASVRAPATADVRLDRALDYFQRGLFYRRVVWRLLLLSPDGLFTASEATLNFYKAVAVILGDDPHGPQSEMLKLDKSLRRRIEHLYKRRTHRDVAHPTSDASAIEELHSTVAGSQEIATKVIEAYVGLLLAGSTLKRSRSVKQRQRRKRP